jgi:hypothetical protein
MDSSGNVVGYAYNTLTLGTYIPGDAVAVVFAPGAPPPFQITAITLDATNVVPGVTVNGTVTLSTAAPAGGVNITFLSTNPAAAATPTSLVIAEGDSSAAFTLPVSGTTLTTPTTFKLYASDGSVSRSVALSVTPVVNISTITANSTEGGLTTSGTVSLTIPAQIGGATVVLSSSNPALVSVPASVILPQGYSSTSFSMTTVAVTALTTVPISATFNGQTVTTSVTLSPQPVISLASISVPAVVGGQSVYGTVSLNSWTRSAAGTVVTLSSGDTGSLQVPASVTIPYGYASASFLVTTNVVPGTKGVSVKAVANGTNLTTTVTVSPIPPITITLAEWDPVTLLFKVQASTNDNTPIFTYGTNAASGPIGTMQLELGVWKGSTLMATAPTTATVWSSFGASASLPVVNKGLASGGGGGGGKTGGGGGGTTTTTSSTYKLSISTNGKGTVTTSPSGTSFAAGTVVTLTATPAAGSPWIGWSGSIFGTSAISTAKTITVTMNANTSLTANFK